MLKTISNIFRVVFIVGILFTLADSIVPFKTNSIALKIRMAEANDPDEEVFALLQKGMDLSDEGDLDKAILVYQEGLERFPDQIAFEESLGIAYYNKMEYEKAAPFLLNTLRTYENHSEVPEIESRIILLHRMLIASYYYIGEKYRFTEEICLRIFYHGEEYLSLAGSEEDDRKYAVLDLLRNIKEKFELAKLGVTVTIPVNNELDLDKAKNFMQNKKLNDPELPEDFISRSKKDENTSRVLQRL